MNIAIGTDHRGFKHKELIKRELFLAGQTITWHDKGAFNDQRSDYPEFAWQVCQSLLKKEAGYGILLCGSGVGMAIAANRFAGIYAALIWNDITARLAKEDDNANILVIPSDFMDDDQVLAAVQAWLLATFKNNRYQERLDQIDSWAGLK